MRRIKKKKDRPVTHDQWVEITRKDGKTITTFYPPNAEFERRRLEMDPPPSLIYRRLNFVHGVPKEYNWTNPTPSIQIWGGCLLHRMKVGLALRHAKGTRHRQRTRRSLPEPARTPRRIRPLPLRTLHQKTRSGITGI
jgi:hypothetical protein